MATSSETTGATHKNAARILVVHLNADIHRRSVLDASAARHAVMSRAEKPTLDGRKLSPPSARQHTPAVGRQQHVLRVRRIHVNIVHDHIRPSRLDPILSRIERAIQILGRPGKHGVQIAWVLQRHSRPPRRRRNAFSTLSRSSAPPSSLLVNTRRTRSSTPRSAASPDRPQSRTRPRCTQ